MHVESLSTPFSATCDRFEDWGHDIRNFGKIPKNSYLSKMHIFSSKHSVRICLKQIKFVKDYQENT